MSLLNLANERKSEPLYQFTDTFFDNSDVLKDYHISDNNYATILAFVESVRTFVDDEPLKLEEIKNMWDVYEPQEFTNAIVLSSILDGYDGNILSSRNHLLSEDKENKTLARAHLALSSDSLDVLIIRAGHTDDNKFYINPLPEVLFSQAYNLVEK